ncbi:histidine kinase [Fibrisoma montanum]|nr:histidine kinase [Fibrisoma montanum]
MNSIRLASFLRHLLFFAIGAIGFCGADQSLAQQFADRKYGVYDGLTYAHVLRLHQDRAGRLWISTVYGLNIYDGTLPISNHRRFPQLPDVNIDEMVSMPDGTLWANTNVRMFKINLTGPTGLAIKEFKVDYGPGAVQRRIRFLTADNRDQLWFTTRTATPNVGQRLYCWRQGQNEDVTRRFFSKPEQRFRGVLADQANRRLLIATEDGRLWQLNDKQLTEIRSNVGVTQLLADPIGRIYALAGTTLYRIDGQTLHRLYDVPVPESYLVCCAVGLHGELAFQKRVGDLDVCWYDGKTVVNSHISTSPVDHLLFDRQGELWIATSHNGLFHLRLNGWRYFDYSEGWLDETNSVSQDRNGKIWFGSWGYGLSRLTAQGIVADSTYHQGRLIRYFYPATRHDTEGNIVFASGENQGVFHFDGEHLRSFPGTDTTGIIAAFYDDSARNRYLLATTRSILIYNRRTLALTDVIAVPFDEQYNDIERDKFGRFWIGGYKTNLIWDGRSRSVQTLRKTDKRLPVQMLNEIRRDKRGNLWLSTDQGLWLYDYKRYRHIAADYIQKTITYCRFLGRYLIIGTLEGLFVMDMERFYQSGEEWIAYFDMDNGFRGSQCLFNGYLHDTQGRVWIPTRDRMMMIPEKQLLNLLKPVQAGIHSFRDLRTGQTIVDESSELRLSSGQNDIEVIFREPEAHNILANTTYSYRLERLDGQSDRAHLEWSAPVKRRTVTFRNLTDGRYRLTIKVVRANGLWNTRPYVQVFRIAPPWWATWWFRTCLIVGVVAGLAYLRVRQVRAVSRRRLKTARTQRRLAQLETEAANKQKQLAEASRQRALLELRAITNQIDPHFVSNFLMTVQSVAFENDPETIVSYLAKFGAIFRNQLTSRSRVFWTLGEELEFVNNYLELEHVRFGDRIRFSVDVRSDVPANTHLPKMLIQGYVSNAIKHGLENKPEGGTVQLTVRQADDRLFICVEDDGVGLDLAKQYRRRSTGRGLSINEAIFNQLNEYNNEPSWQRITDLIKMEPGRCGVRQEASIPLYPKLPPEEAAVDPVDSRPVPKPDASSALNPG